MILRNTTVCHPTVINTLLREFPATDLLSYKTPLRDVPRGVAQERTENHTARDTAVSYAYDT